MNHTTAPQDSTVTVADPQQLTRRSVLLAGGGGAGLIVLSACSARGAGDSDDGGPEGPDPDRPHESPMLTELVEQGELPPLEERLPIEEDRLVVETPEYGVYGGTYEGAVLGPGDDPWINRLVAFEPPLRTDPELIEVGLPGVLKEVESAADGMEYVLHLRRGLRWSDGEPVTADDVMFSIEEVYFNEELHGSPPGMLSFDGEPCSAERLDDFTVRIVFPGPKGDFVDILSRNALGGGNFFYYPKHYCEQFIPHINGDAESLADEAGFSDWTSYFEDRMAYFNNPDKPTLNPWLITNPLNSGDATILERNPYYWKVDADGAQLPYIDTLHFDVVQDEEVMLLKAVNGELDFHARHFNIAQNRPVLAEAREAGDFDFVAVRATSSNHVVVALNLNHQDDELREIFQNKDFRIGLSHAIDRQEVIDTVFQRQGEPWQAAPAPDSKFFDEEFAKQYTEYDLELANQHLDAVLPERDSAGFRLRPNGDRLRINIDVSNADPERVSAMELIIGQWEGVGVGAQVNTIERTLFYDRKSAAANEHDANVWGADGGFRVEMIETRWWFPSTDESNYAPRWANWYSTRGRGEFSEEPPEEARRQMELYQEILKEPDIEERERIFREILEISKEQFYAIGVVLRADDYGIVKNDLRNVPDSYINSAPHLSPGPTNPPIWFFDR